METIFTLQGEPTQLTSDQVAAQEAVDEIWEQVMEEKHAEEEEYLHEEAEADSYSTDQHAYNGVSRDWF